jgi:hypothetical protein
MLLVRRQWSGRFNVRQGTTAMAPIAPHALQEPRLLDMVAATVHPAPSVPRVAMRLQGHRLAHRVLPAATQCLLAQRFASRREPQSQAEACLTTKSAEPPASLLSDLYAYVSASFTSGVDGHSASDRSLLRKRANKRPNPRFNRRRRDGSHPAIYANVARSSHDCCTVVNSGSFSTRCCQM